MIASLVLLPPLAALAGEAGNPWQGEWSFARGEDEGGFISIRGCSSDNTTCVLQFGTHGQTSCESGDIRKPTSQGLTFLAEGAAATFPLKTILGEITACTLSMELDNKHQPPRIKAELSGSDCDNFCDSPKKHFSTTFTLRSRAPYLQFSTYHKVYACFVDDSPAMREWCTNETIFALQQTWLLRQQQLTANVKADRSTEWGIWEEKMLDQCNSAPEIPRCISDGYQQQIRALSTEVYGRFLNGTISGEQVLSTLHPKFDPRTAKTGETTDVNTVFRHHPSHDPSDEVVVFFKIAELPFLPGHLVVLEALSDGFTTWLGAGVRAKAFFSLLKAEAGHLSIVTREPIRTIDSPPQDVLPWGYNGTGASLRLDLADYRINEKERAFGYRLTTWDGGTEAAYGEEVLVLYRLTPQGMKMVLDDIMESHDQSWDNQAHQTIEYEKETYTLVVSPNKHEGNYDWIERGKKVNGPSGRARATKARTLIWKNGEYVLEGGQRSTGGGSK